MQALNGIRILEPGQLVAAPFASTLLGDFGAEVIKTELPGRGDPARGLGPFTDDGASIWWKTVSRNKKSISLDLRRAKGQAIFLAHDRDAIIAFAAEHDVTIAPVQDMADIARDPQFAHRGALIDVADDEMGALTMVRPTPVLSETPGEVRHAGPPVGANNGEIYQGLLGMSDAELASLQEEGII